MKIKTFMCNADGVHNLLVAARSMRQASLLTGIPYHCFRVYGHETFNENDCCLALRNPGVVYKARGISKDWKAIDARSNN